PINPTPASSNYPSNVEAIVQNNCTNSGCHGEGTSLNLTSWEKMFAGSTTVGAVVVPYSNNWSHLFQHINTYTNLGLTLPASDVMPPSPKSPLSEANVQIIKDWILAGAKSQNNDYFWKDQETKVNNKMIALCSGSDLVAIVDIPTNRIMRYVEVGKTPGATGNANDAPHFIILSPDKKFFYVTLYQSGYVEKYRTDTYEFMGRVSVGTEASLMTLNQAGTRMIITHDNETSAKPKLSLINTDNMTVLSQIVGDGNTLARPHGLAAKSDFSMIYVSTNLGNYYGKYRVTADQIEEVDKISFDNDPPSGTTLYGGYEIVLSGDGSKLFVSCKSKDEIRVYNTANDSPIATIPTDDFPRLMVYDAPSNRIFVTCALATNTAVQGSITGCIQVIDVATNTSIKKIYQVGHRPHGIRIDGVNRKLYVSSENTGGVDVPHHQPSGTNPPGKYAVIDLNTLETIPSMQTDIAEFPTSLCVSN
ncbi:MAG: YncE family protein, partial [Bacteroidia bacterium]